MTPDDYCQTKAARSGSSFYYSFMFLPPDQRRAITALYAFCREIDDVVDECNDAQVARVKLQWWRDEMQRAYTGTPQHPVTQALAPYIYRLNLALDLFMEIIAGMEMDLDYPTYATFADLRVYCHRVAGVVGSLAAEIFGYSDRRTLEYAENLGLAFQLTNILRDVSEDAQRGRIYLPQDELAQYGVSNDDIRQQRDSPAFQQLLKHQAQRARLSYEHAFALLPAADRFKQRSGLIMAAIYLRTLDAIEKDGFHVLQRRVRLSPLRKLWIAWTTAYKENRRHDKQSLFNTPAS